MDILHITSLVKFIIALIGVIGIIMLITALVKGNTELIRRAAYLIIIAVVMYVCGYFFVRKTEQRVVESYYELYE